MMKTHQTEFSDETAVEKLRLLWESAGMKSPSFPVSTSVAAEILSGGGYRTNALMLDTWADVKIIETDRDEFGKAKWGPTALWQAVLHAERRRLWRLDSRHVSKMSPLEVLQLEAEQNGFESCFHDLDSVDVDALLQILEESEILAVRHVAKLALQAKMRQGGLL